VSDRDIDVPSGRLRARSWEPDRPADGPLVLCIPGLSSNLTSFNLLGPALAARGRRAVALDLRGRGHSQVTPVGTYGWDAHARDVLDAARALGAERFDLVGHSMGAYIGMIAAAGDPERIRRLVLIDGAGRTEPSTVEPITSNLGRLDRWHDSEEEYLALARDGGLAAPWSEAWEDFFRYELETGEDGAVRARTNLPAVMEDISYGGGVDQRELWPRLRAPTLLLRATQPLGDSGGFVVPAADAEGFAATVEDARVIEVEANHFGVLFHERTTSAAVDFLT
jgi:pimeloyl-ACP methyl ester carboxylesterase